MSRARMLHGRDTERRLLAARIDALRAGSGFALLLDGPAGIGKSALLADAVARAGGVRVVEVCGYEPEAELPFAGLLGVLAPLLDRRGDLPAGPRRALESALALAAPEPYDPFALRVAVAAILARAAEDAPLLVVVDDAQWLDEDSLEALAFAARRPAGPGVGVLLAAREGADAAPLVAGIERVTLGPLDPAVARGVLAEGDRLAPAVAEAILRAGDGNPLALRELPRALTPEQRRGEQPLAMPLAASGPVVDAFGRVLDGLDPDQQRALSVVAAAGGAGPAVVTAALERLSVPPGAVEGLRGRGLLRDAGEGALRARHPLLASAAYQRVTRAEARAVHAALARGAGAADPSRRAWHLAQTATGPDPEIAAEVDRAAADARARGGHAESARAFLRAADLSDDPAEAARRRLEAARDFAQAGHGHAALQLTEEVAREPGLRPAADRLRAHLLMRGGDPGTAHELLEQLATRAEEAGDPEAAAQMLLEASMTHMFGGDMQALLDSADRARSSSSGVSPELELVATLVTGEALVALGRAAEGDALLAAAEPLLLQADPLSPIAEVLGMGAMASMWIGRFDRAERVLDGLVERARAAGAAGRLPYPLAVRSQLRWRRGQWPAALADAHEAVQLARDTGQDGMLAVTLPGLARAEAGRGRIAQGRAHAEEGLALGAAAAGDATVVHSLAALGFVELTDGRPVPAAEALDRAAKLARRHAHGEPALTLHAADHVEALARAGRRTDAEAALARLEKQAAATGGAWATAAAARCRVLLRPLDELDAHAAAARAAHDELDLPFERARTELAIGERLRRERRRGAAREPLDAARRTFDALEAAPWAARARLELEAGGARVDAAAAPLLEELTPHELRIALLVGEGTSNADVAAALFVSRKTVEHHLTAIYRKLGLRSRTQLAALVAEHDAA